MSYVQKGVAKVKRQVVRLNDWKGDFTFASFGDNHLIDKDRPTLKGYNIISEKVLYDIFEAGKELKLDAYFHLGDLYDRGYAIVGMDRRHESLIKKMKDSVNGLFFLVIGNHICIGTDTNPEIFMIQPSERYKPSINIMQEEPVLKTPDEVVIYDTQISLFHHNNKHTEEAKDYTSPRLPGIKHRIGLYHDECIIPPHIRKSLGMHTEVSHSYLQHIFGDMDYVICGDIHIPYPRTKFNIGDRVILMDIPGSPSITSTDMAYRYPSIDMPVVTIRPGGYSVNYKTISTRLNEYTFAAKGRDPLTEVKRMIKTVSKTTGVTRVNTLFEYYDRLGLPVSYKNIAKAAYFGTLDMSTLVKEILELDEDV